MPVEEHEPYFSLPYETNFHLQWWKAYEFSFPGIANVLRRSRSTRILSTIRLDPLFSNLDTAYLENSAVPKLRNLSFDLLFVVLLLLAINTTHVSINQAGFLGLKAAVKQPS